MDTHEQKTAVTPEILALAEKLAALAERYCGAAGLTEERTALLLRAVEAALRETSGPDAGTAAQIVAVRTAPANRWAAAEAWMKEHGCARNADLQQLLGVSTATASRLLREWTDAGKLRKVRVGSYWTYERSETPRSAP